MASVFLSYDRDDTGQARHYAQALERAGHRVWWDLHVRGGAQFSKIIEEALKAADAVVVLWSKNSVESAWVRDEAAVGRDSGRLVPVTIDGTDPPLGFRQYQVLDLSRWKGRGSPSALRTLLNDVAAMAPPDLERPVEPGGAAHDFKKPVRFHRSWQVASAVLAIMVVAGALLLWRPWSSPAAPTLLVRSASTDSSTRALARDLMVNLGSLQSVQSAPVELISEPDLQGQGGKADLILEVASAAESKSTGANLLIKRPANGVILWSQDFENTTGNISDFKQQITSTSARVVGCLGEAFDPKRKRLDDAMLKLYINSCAHFAEAAGADPGPIVASLRQVTDKEPQFAGAWKKLLIAEMNGVEAARESGTNLAPMERALRSDIESARKIDPAMPETILAELAFLRATDVQRRMQIVDRAKIADPNDVEVLRQRATELQKVGRMRDAVDDARRALELGPLSPDVHASYFWTLLMSGNLSGAQQALDEVQRLWPNSRTARELEFEYNLRDGDPRKALAMAQQQSLLGLTKMLEARIDPSQVQPYLEWLIDRKDYDTGRLAVVVQALGLFHREDELYKVVFSWPNRNDVAETLDVWFRPHLREFRRDPRFITLMSRTPLLEYWEKSGSWADFCFQPDLPYDCKKRAAEVQRQDGQRLNS